MVDLKSSYLLNQICKWLDFGVHSTYFSISWNFCWNASVDRWRCHQFPKNLSFWLHFSMVLCVYWPIPNFKGIKRLLRAISLIWDTSRQIRIGSRGVNIQRRYNMICNQKLRIFAIWWWRHLVVRVIHQNFQEIEK